MRAIRIIDRIVKTSCFVAAAVLAWMVLSAAIYFAPLPTLACPPR